MTDLYTSRTPALEYQRCKRKRYLSTHFPTGGKVAGLEPVRQSVALTVGGCFHEAAAYLLAHCTLEVPSVWREGEDVAVAIALEKFNRAAAAGLELEAGETLAQAQAAATTPERLAEFGAVSQEETAALATLVSNGASEFDRYLALEQAALLEGLVRAWARRGLPRLLEEYEVLEVEREGRWRLSDVALKNDSGEYEEYLLWFLSRPDALLRHRQTGDLALQSFKTTGQWDRRKEKDAQRDVQGLTEVVEVEQRLGEWWQVVQVHKRADGEAKGDPEVVGHSMYQYLASLPAPPRISAIRYEYLLKGERESKSRLAKGLSERVGFEARVQQSRLCYLWVKPGMTIADAELAHSFSWTDAEGKERKLAWQHWQQAPVWEQPGGVKAWIDLLDQNAVQPEIGRDVLAEVAMPPMLVYRQDDDLLDVVEQLEAQETAIAQDVAAVAAAQDDGARRSELNRRFPQSRSACSWPGECIFVPICFGGADARRDPMGTGRYKQRVPNHPLEAGDGKQAEND